MPTAGARARSTTPLRREQMVARLRRSAQSDSDKLDLLIIGGGATGSGIALDAALRGMKVGLVERADFGSETSSRSTKLIWAGIKYLATAVAGLLQARNLIRPIAALESFSSEIRLVSAAHRERIFLLERQAHLTAWLPICVPITSWIMFPAPLGQPIFSLAPLVLPLVLKVYDWLSGWRCPPSYAMSTATAAERFPQLDKTKLKYAAVFYEGMHNDARTALAIALTAAECGAAVVNHVEATGLSFGADGRVSGATCLDVLSDETWQVAARHVVFAAGPFTDSLRAIASKTVATDSQFEPAVRASAGTHVVLPGRYTPSDMGLLDINTSDGRFLFVVPWLGSTVVGTTDRPSAPVSSPAPPEEDVYWLLKESAKYLTSTRSVSRTDVASAWRGWRPLAVDPYSRGSDDSTSFNSRDHVVATDPTTGLVFVAGGKWTTYREMAQAVVDCFSDVPCTTLEKPLIGGDGFISTEHLVGQLRQAAPQLLDAALIEHLACTYGTRALDLVHSYVAKEPSSAIRIHPDFPYIEAEVAFACDREMAGTVEDILALRTRLAYLDSDAAIQAAPKVTNILAKLKGWNEADRSRNLDRALKELAHFAGRHRRADSLC